MELYLVFVKGRRDGRESIAPVTAANRDVALQIVTRRYPAAEYEILTCHAANNVQDVLDGAQRRQKPLDTAVEATIEQAPALTLTAADVAAQELAAKRQRQADVLQRLAQARHAGQGHESMDFSDCSVPMSVSAHQETLVTATDTAAVVTTEGAGKTGLPNAQLRQALALLRAQQAAGGTVGGAITQSAEPADVRPQAIARGALATAEAHLPRINRQPEVVDDSPVISKGPAHGPQSVIEVFKGVRR